MGVWAPNGVEQSGRLSRSLPLSRFEELSDAVLVCRSKADDRQAFGELIRRYQDKIYTIVFGQVRSTEDALDLTQEVFLKAWRRLASFREDSVFYTWLYRIAINTCVDHARRRRRAPEPFSLESETLTEAGFEPVDARPESDPERVAGNREMRDLLYHWIETLPQPMRLAVILHDIQGLSQKEIASIMDCPLGTVKSRIQRGRCELREKLQSYLA